MRIIFIVLSLLVALPVWAISESKIEKLVENAPIAKSHSDMKKLVEALTKGLKEDEDKAYSILMWIVKNIDYDDYKMRQIEEKARKKNSRVEIPDSGDILKTRLGVCADIASLYEKMADRAGLKAVVIKGCTSDINKKTRKCRDGSPGHEWNAVWIDDQWEFVDPTWAITGGDKKVMEDIEKKNKYERELKKRERKDKTTYEMREGRYVDKQWFMTEPDVMERDHHPYDEKWLLKKKKDRKSKKL